MGGGRAKKIHTGPRGGKYYFQNGRKVYITSEDQTVRVAGQSHRITAGQMRQLQFDRMVEMGRSAVLNAYMNGELSWEEAQILLNSPELGG